MAQIKLPPLKAFKHGHSKGPWIVAALPLLRELTEEEANEVIRIAQVAYPALVKASTHVLLECPGIWNTCQATGETFGLMLNDVLQEPEVKV